MKRMPHDLFDAQTERLLKEDRQWLENSRFPIITISASFRDEVEAIHKVRDNENHPDVVFSRAHYSMALGVAVAAWGSDKPDQKKSWLVDPTNYVTRHDWSRVATSETLGRLIARHPILQWVKNNILDTYGRKNFPLEREITPPTLYLTEKVNKPIISLHIVTGNILAKTGKKIVQVVTDPHVREDYLLHADLPNMTYCVFDDKTRFDFLEKAQDLGKKVDPNRVVVTGPPVDPRILAARAQKKTDSYRRRSPRILLTTGGLGTNKNELAHLLQQILPLTRKRSNPIQIVYYAGTNQDHVEMVTALAKEAHVAVGKYNDRRAAFRILSHDNIVDANNLLLLYGLPWADVVYTKPSGDMAYDASLAGAALILLEPWGEWEKNVAAIFTQRDIARWMDTKHPAEQLQELTDALNDHSWLEHALEQTRLLPPHFYHGAENILHVAQKVGRQG